MKPVYNEKTLIPTNKIDEYIPFVIRYSHYTSDTPLTQEFYEQNMIEVDNSDQEKRVKQRYFTGKIQTAFN